MRIQGAISVAVLDVHVPKPATVQADVNTRMEDNSTALFVACMKGNYALADLLITAGADVTATDRPPIHRHAAHRHVA